MITVSHMQNFEHCRSILPECHDVPVSTEAGQAHTVAQRYHISSKHKGRLCDVVDKEAGL